jgi:peptide/nickel transport system ATP-binding protein
MGEAGVAPPADAILRVESLRTYFGEGDGVKKAVDDVSFELERARTLGLAGESGCGKSVTSLSIMRLVPQPPGRIVGGRVILDGRNLLDISGEEMRKVRGRDISMIFQEPMTSLNPVFTVGAQLAEVFETHLGAGRNEARARSAELLARVGLPDSESRLREYPHQLSGGMRQRVLIAMALAASPRVLIADEPTTALDVTIQAQILELIDGLRAELGMGTLLITHDLGVMAEVAHSVAIMYAGRIVESAPRAVIFSRPFHPYTIGLLASLPSAAGGGRGERLNVIPGVVPDLADLPPGCSFEPRCPRRREICRREPPPTEAKEEGHYARCWVPP